MSSLQKASLDEIRNAASRICRDYLTGKWKVVRSEDLIVKRISGGLSNFLYYVALPGGDSDDNSKADIENSVDSHSTSIHTDQDAYEGVHDISEESVAESSNKRQRTDSGGEHLASFATKSHSYTISSENEPQQVLLRIYGQSHGEDALEAMITESVVFALLSERNFGPKLHGIFPGGRIEQYIPARALVTMELSDEHISKKIAEKMGEIHSLNIPMSKEPDWIWNCMDRWLVSVNNLMKDKSIRNKHQKNANTVFDFDFASEAAWLRSIIDEAKFTVVFCHNDLQEGNILFMEPGKLANQAKTRYDVMTITADSDTVMEESISHAEDNLKRKRSQINNNSNANISHPLYQIDHEVDNTRDSAFSMNSSSFVATDEENEQGKQPNLMIIDFEYCAYNYRGFDLANHFLEWTFDYTNPEFPFFYHLKRQYPTEKQRLQFITSYLRKVNASVPDYEPTVDDIEFLQYEVRVFSMLSHLFWSFWSIVNLTSNIEFGYWEYAVSRIQEYKNLKYEFLQKNFNNLANNNHT